MVGHAQDLGDGAELILKDIDLNVRYDTPAEMLSYAEQRALEIGITIAGGADVIMLDELMAGMSHSETGYIVDLIRRVIENKTLVWCNMTWGLSLGWQIAFQFWFIVGSSQPAHARRCAQIPKIKKPI